MSLVPSKVYHLWALLLIVSLGFLYGMTGRNLSLNWDEEASVDIATGIRPAMVTDSAGLPLKALRYDQIVADTAFTAASYEYHNTPGGVVTAVMQDNSNAFLYYLSLHYLLKAGGFSLLLMRLFTILAAAINLFLVYRLTLALSPKKYYWALAALLIVGVNPIFFSQAFMIRGYMLCLSFLLLSTQVWLQIIRHQSFRWQLLLWHSGLCLLAVLTHYFAIAIVAGQFLYLFLVWYLAPLGVRRTGWQQLLTSLLVFLVPLIGWYLLSWHIGIPNLYLLDRGWQHAAAGTGYAIGPFNYLKQLFNATASMIGFDYSIGGVAKAAWQALAVVVIACLIGLLLKTYTIRKRKAFNLMLYLWAVAILVYSCCSWQSGHFMIFERKYLVFLLPYLIVGLIVWASRFINYKSFRWLGISVAAVILLVSAVTLVINAQRWKGEDTVTTKEYMDDGRSGKTTIGGSWQELAALGKELSAKLCQQDTIVFTQWKTAHDLNYFLRQCPDIRQMVNTSLDSSETIIIKNGNKRWTLYFK